MTKRAWMLGVGGVGVVAALLALLVRPPERGGSALAPGADASASRAIAIEAAPRAGELAEREPAQPAAGARAAPALFRGRVLGPEEQPLAGALVELRRRSAARVFGSVRTDAEGRFALQRGPLQPRELLLVASASGYVAATSSPPSLEKENVVRLQPLEPLAELRGRVVDAATDEPIAGALVADSGGERVETDGEGWFRLTRGTLDSEVTLHVLIDGYVVLEQRARHLAPGSPPLELRLEPAARWTLELFDLHSGAPIAGAAVKRERRRIGKSDEAGRLDVYVDEGELVKLELEAEGYLDGWVSAPANRVEPRLVRRVPMLRPAFLEGRVVDAKGEAVTNVALGVDHARLDDTWELPADELAPLGVVVDVGVRGGPAWSPLHDSDPAGAFRIAVPPRPEPWAVRVTPASREEVVFLHGGERGDSHYARAEPARVERPGETARVELVLPALAGLRGRVSAPGVTAALAVRCEDAAGRSAEARLDADGAYELTGLAPGPALVSVVGAELDSGADPVRVELRAGWTLRHDLRVRPRALPITGRVLDGSGAPVVTAVRGSASGGGGVSAISGPDGSYSLPTWPGAPWRVYVSEEVERLGVPAGAEGVDFVLDLPVMGRLRLECVDAASGEPLEEGLQVSWRRSGSGGFQRASEATPTVVPGARRRREPGVLELELPAGTLDLRLASIGGDSDYALRELRSVHVEAEAEPRTLRVELERGFRARLRFSARDEGEPAAPPGHLLFLLDAGDEGALDERDPRAKVALDGLRLHLADPLLLRRRVEPDRAGDALVRGLAPGRYRLRAVPDDLGLEPEWIEVAEEGGATCEVVWSER